MEEKEDEHYHRILSGRKPKEPFPERGKWVVHGKPEKLKQLAESLKPLVKEGVILSIKYSKNQEAFGRKQSVLIAYCDKEHKDTVEKHILEKGYHPKWKTNRETVLDSLPGGSRYEYERKRLGKPPGYAKAHVEWCKKEGIIPLDWNETQIRKWVRQQKKHLVKHGLPNAR